MVLEKNSIILSNFVSFEDIVWGMSDRPGEYGLLMKARKIIIVAEECRRRVTFFVQ